MNLIQGEAVTVIRTGRVLDELGEPTYGEDAREEVESVVVAPGATADLDASRPEGVTVAYTLCFPKTYAGELKGCAVEVRARTVTCDPAGPRGARRQLLLGGQLDHLVQQGGGGGGVLLRGLGLAGGG